MTAREEWDALDAPEPVATPAPRTALRAEWDSLDADEPNATPIPTTADLRAEWDALDAAPPPPSPAAESSATPMGGLAAFGGAQPESTVDWGAVKASLTPAPSTEENLVREKGGDPLAFLSGVLRNEQAKIPNAERAAPWALPIIASIAAPENIVAQTGASLVGGAAGRYKAGEPVLDKKAMLLDLLAPIGVNTAIGVGKELATPLLKYANPDAYEAIHDIRKGWANLGTVTPTGAVAQELAQKGPARATVDVAKDILGSPIEAGAASKVQELRDAAKRVAAYSLGRNRIQEYLDRTGREIFTEAVPGVRGTVLRQRQAIPLADREDMKLLLEGYKTADQVAPHVVDRAAKLKQVYEHFGELGQELGLLHPGAPMVRSRFGTPDPAYTGPNIPKNPDEAATYLADLTRMGHEGKRNVGFRERVAHKYFEPEIHDADALRGFEAYKNYAPEQFAAAYAFGAPGEYTSLAKAVEGFGKRQLAPGASVAKSTGKLIEQRIPGATVAEGGTKAFGRDINELLNRASAQDLSPSDRGAMESIVGSLNQIYHTGERSPMASLAGKAVGTTLLPLSWLQQYGQQAWNIAKPGLQNNVRGLVRYARDPDFRALIQASGGRGSSMEHLFNEMVGEPGAFRDFARAGLARLPTSISEPIERGASRLASSRLGEGASNLAAYLPQNLVGKSIGFSESMLRGPLGAGHYVHTEDLIQRALDAAATTGTLSRGLSRELREAGINEADVLAGSPDLLSAHTLRNAGATLTGRYQLMSGDPGHSSARIIGSPWGRVAAQFKSFPLGSARLFKSDVLEPLYSGVRNRDMSELALGGGRLARLVPASVGAAYAAKAGKELVRGKSPADWAFEDVPGQAASTVGGMLYDLPAAIYKGEDPATGEWDAWEAAKNVGETLTPPIFGALRRPDPSKFSLLAANALAPKLGAALTMLSPAWQQYQKPAENPIAKLRREIEQARKRGR
jgi:hypothetical protein